MPNRETRRAAKKSHVNPDPLTITFWSNAIFAPTGYGTQTKQAVPRMIADGHHVAVAANYGLQCITTEYEGVIHFPMGYSPWSDDVVEAYHQDWNRQHPDGTPLVISLFDVWPLAGPQWERMPVAAWTMVDHVPVPPKVAAFSAQPNVTPIAVSRFGEDQFHRVGVDCLYVPLAIDTDIYKPTATWRNGGTELAGWQLMGWDDDDGFTVTIAAANKGVPGRKAWGEQLLAFSIFAERHADARLYIHAERHGNMGGMPLDPIIESVGLKKHQYRFVNQYALHLSIPDVAMAALFSATDVLLSASYSEGFGLTVVEAQACGAPAIVNDFTAQPELLGDGWMTTNQVWWDAPQASYWAIPSVMSIVDCLEAAYARGKGRSETAIAFAQGYDADLVYDTYWRPALATIAQAQHRAPVLADPASRTWTRGEPDPDVRLTIYIPTYKRPEVADLLASLAPQLDARVEVIVSDNDPAGSALPAVRTHLADAGCYVEYSRRNQNIGGDSNIMRGYEAGRADWVWVIGDDDTVLPGAVADVLDAIDHDDLDRLILLTATAPSNAAGMVGTLTDIAQAEPALPIAATLISANVVRRRALDLALARRHLDTMYAHSWANTTCHRVKVLAAPAITCGTTHAGEYAHEADCSGDIEDIWTDLLRGYGLEATAAHFAWNFVSVQLGP